MSKSMDLFFGKSWQYFGDLDALGCGGKWFREVSYPEENRHGLWQFIELTNMDEACGSENEGRARYVIELSEVNLTTAEVDAAMRSCGYEPRDGIVTDAMRAEACHGYGARAPMGSWEGNNAHKLLREAGKEARDLDPRNGCNILRGMKLASPVNAIGSTAEEYARGDIYSALARGLKRDDPAVKIVAKMYGMEVKP